MSLDGAQLNFINAAGVTEKYAAKGRKFIVGSYLSSDLVLSDAQRLHCEIQCDAFGRVTIYNHSDMPIIVNDQEMNAATKRPLQHGSRIQILNDVYTWHFPSSDGLITPDRMPPDQAPRSSSTLKSNRLRRLIDSRLTVHNFRYSINSDDEGNTSIEERELEANSSINAEKTISAKSPESADSSTPDQKRSNTPTAEDIDETSPKVDLLEATQNKENTSTPSNKLMLQLCARSDVVITSFSPRETGVRIEKSFTRVVKPSTGFGQISTPTTPKSVYNTPKGVLSELNDDSCSRDLLEISAPSTSKKAIAGKRESSMYLIDLTTPQKLRPTLSTTPKTTPGSADIISLDSSKEYSDSSPSVIDITSTTPDSSIPAKLKQQRTVLKTPKEQLLAAGSTPKRTPQSLMKRALLTSVKKKIIADINTPKTPAALPNARQSLLDGRRQCLTAPRRLPFHPQPQWRTPARRPGIAALTNKAPQTSPRKRLSMSLSSPRENKISLLRKSLAAAAKISPNVGISNKLVAKARRALNSPKQNSPKRIESPKIDTETLNRSQEFSPHETSTPDEGQNSSAELSRTFTIDDDNHDKSKDMTEGSVSALEMMSELVTDEYALNDSVKTTEDITPDQKASNQLEISLNVDQKSNNLNETEEKEALNKTLESVISTKDPAVHIPIICLNNSPLDGAEKDLTEDEKTPIKSLCTAGSVAVIDDSICEEVPTTPTQGQHEEQNILNTDVAPMNDVQLVDDTICDEVPTSGEDTPTVHANANEQEDDDVEVIAPPGETPIPRRSLRRLSIDQNTGSMTPRRSVRRASMDANIKIEQCTKPSRRASYSAVVESKTNAATLATPKRKRRLTEELSTPTRKSLRLCNTPKKPINVDDAVGDMGVILEEDGGRAEADRESLTLDEDYGTELPAKDIDEHDKIDYHGMRELLKTPKSCSTPHFKGLREMIRTPKAQSSPMLDHINELLEPASTDISNTPKRHLTVSRVTLELSKSESNAGDAQDMYFKTPRGKNIMIPIEPASAVLKTQSSLATTTEYDLNATDATLHLDKIFDDVLTTEATNAVIAIDESENEMNVTEIGTAAASEVDPLGSSVTPNTDANDTVRSEKLMNFLHKESARKDPLTSTTFKNAPHSKLDVSAMKDKRPKSPEDCEMSGIQFLDQTTDSIFSEALVVTGVDSFDLTVEETKTAENVKTSIRTSKKGIPDEGSDTDSMVGLAEPLVVSDDDTDLEELEQGECSKLKKDLSKVTDAGIDKSVVIKDTSLQIDSEQDATHEEQLSEDQEKNENDLDSLVDIKSIKPNDSEITTVDESIQQFDNNGDSTIYPVDESELVVNKTRERSHTDKEKEESSIDNVDNDQNEYNNDTIIEENEKTKTEEDLSVGLETSNQLKGNETSIMEINTSSNDQAKSTDLSSNDVKSSVEATTANVSVVELETYEIEKIQAIAEDEGTTAINSESNDVENLKLDLVNNEVDNENESIADTSSSVAITDVIEDPSNQAELHTINEDPNKGNKENMESMKNEEKSKPIIKDDCIVTEAQNESLTETESVSEIVTTSPAKILTKPKEEVAILETQSASEHTSVTTSPVKTKTIEEVPTMEESVIDLDISNVEEPNERAEVETPLDNCSRNNSESVVEKVDFASENISNPSEQESIEDVKLDTLETQNNVNADKTINEEASVSFDKQLDESTLPERTAETPTTSQHEESQKRLKTDNVKLNDDFKDISETVDREDHFVDSIPERESKETIVSEISFTEEQLTGSEKPDTVDVPVINLDEGVKELENSSCDTNVSGSDSKDKSETVDKEDQFVDSTSERKHKETTVSEIVFTEEQLTGSEKPDTVDVPVINLDEGVKELENSSCDTNVSGSDSKDKSESIDKEDQFVDSIPEKEPKESIASEIVFTEEQLTGSEKLDTVDVPVINLDEGVKELENSSCDTNVSGSVSKDKSESVDKEDQFVDSTPERKPKEITVSEIVFTEEQLTGSEKPDTVDVPVINSDEDVKELENSSCDTNVSGSDSKDKSESIDKEDQFVDSIPERKPKETTESEIVFTEEQLTGSEKPDTVDVPVINLDEDVKELENSSYDTNEPDAEADITTESSDNKSENKNLTEEKDRIETTNADESATEVDATKLTSLETSDVQINIEDVPGEEVSANKPLETLTELNISGAEEISEASKDYIAVVELDDSRVEELSKVDQNVITVETVPASLSSFDIVDEEPVVEKDKTQTDQQRPEITSTSNMVESSAAPSPEMLTNTKRTCVEISTVNTHDDQTGGKDIEHSMPDTVLTTEKPLDESDDTKILEDAPNNSKEGKELISDSVITVENTLVKTESHKLSEIDGKLSNETVLRLDTEDNKSPDDILQKTLDKETVVNKDKLVVEDIDELSKEEDTSGMAKIGEQENDLPEPDSVSFSASIAQPLNDIRSKRSSSTPVIELDDSNERDMTVNPTGNNTSTVDNMEQDFDNAKIDTNNSPIELNTNVKSPELSEDALKEHKISEDVSDSVSTAANSLLNTEDQELSKVDDKATNESVLQIDGTDTTEVDKPEKLSVSISSSSIEIRSVSSPGEPVIELDNSDEDTLSTQEVKPISNNKTEQVVIITTRTNKDEESPVPTDISTKELINKEEGKSPLIEAKDDQQSLPQEDKKAKETLEVIDLDVNIESDTTKAPPGEEPTTSTLDQTEKQTEATPIEEQFITAESEKTLQEECRTDQKTEQNLSADLVEHTTHSEDPINSEKPKRRGRKASVDVAETKTHSEEDVGSEKPKRRGRRASLEAADNKVDSKAEATVLQDIKPVEKASPEPVKEKPKRRYRKASAEIKEENEKLSVPETKPKRNTRKKSAETVECETTSKDHLDKIDEAAEPEQNKQSKIRASLEAADNKVDVDNKVEDVIDSIAEATVLQDIKPVEKTSPEPVKEKPKRRYRKASAEIKEENEKLSVPETKPKRNTRKKSAETVEDQTTSKDHLDKIDEAAEPEQNNLQVEAAAVKVEPLDTGAVQKAKRRGRKPSANDAKEPEQKPNEAADAEKPRSRRRSMTVEPAKEQPVVPDEDHKVKRRGRKRSTSVEHIEESQVAPAQKVLKTTDSESEHEAKRRGNKKIKSEEDVEEEEDHNVKLRGRKRSISVPDRQLLGETDAHADHKVKRRGRKRSISVEHIEEPQVAPAQKVVKSNNLESEHEVKRRGNKKAKPAEDDEETPTDTPDKIVETSASREKSVPRRGRKATTDEDASATEHKPKRRGQKNVLDGSHIDEPVKSIAKTTRRGRMASADVAGNETPVDKKPTRRGRKPSANVEAVEEPSTQQKKETTRRVRKGSASVANNELDEELKKQNVSSRVIVESTSSEDELTARRREGRNLPRKNYDETSDEDKPSSARKARKVLSSKVAATPTAGKTLGTETLQVASTPVSTKPMTPVVTAEPVEQLDLCTPNVNTASLPEPTSSQKREGRNMPRKNYYEISDDEEPGTSRGRRVRHPTVKALELLVDSTPRPVTPRRRKGKAAADVDTEEPVEKTTVEESIPTSAKTRTPGRRKAQVVEEPTSAAEASVPATSKRVARKRKESGDETVVAKVDQKQPAKRNARGNAANAKTTDEETEDHPATKKARGGARALTPAVVEPEKIIDLDDIMKVPITKRAPAARLRAARAVKVTEEAEIIQEALPPTRTGRGRKVHFETTTEDVPSAAMEPQTTAAEAPKRATRSRRK